MASSDSISCECGQVLFDVANREPGETLTCPWCSKEYRFLGGSKVERIKSKAKKDKEKEAPSKDSTRESSRKNAAKETVKKIVIEGDEEVFKFNSADQETVKMKALSARRKQASVRTGDAEIDGETPPPKKKGPGFGDAPGGVTPMLGFMVGFSLLAFMALGAIFPETPQHRRQAPWGGMLELRSPWPELIAMIAGQVMGFVGWGFYAYRLHLRQKAAKEAAADEAPEKNEKLDKISTLSTKKVSVRRASKRETKRERDDDDDDADDDEDSDR